MGRVTVHSVHSFSPGITIESVPVILRNAYVGMENCMITLIIGHQTWLGDGAL